ncbi:hypothetical protein [Leeuwenhoekiella parthenopeia]|uniref:Uncharacterized protein n=1 Tax=Leeuwenhoekiella parthenopeia TaxID=2890320 RepID=A0ABS8GQ51_9FLAO|nr:hypothetical protein [Leeuwenhoekiella parthenopeia]MCC4211886.1 hypothetical protein [Leeuwenhoekiella parthenopeia]
MGDAHSEDMEFLDVYRQLNELKLFYLEEESFKLKLEQLSTIEDDTALLSQFYMENQEVYSNHLFKFFIEYYDEVGSDCIKVFLLSDNECIRVEASCFYNTITFSDVFKNTFSLEK